MLRLLIVAEFLSKLNSEKSDGDAEIPTKEREDESDGTKQTSKEEGSGGGSDQTETAIKYTTEQVELVQRSGEY